MKPRGTDFILVTCISLSLLLLKREVNADSKPFQARVSDAMNSGASICHDGFMSVYISKGQFADLPLTIYVQDEHGGYYQAISVAKQCLYFLGESEAFILLTVASHGCFVRRQKYMTNLTVVIMALADWGAAEVVKSIPLICERKIKEVDKNDDLAQSTRLGIKVRGEQSENPSTLKSEGILRTEMRFAKDSNYKSFYSSRAPQTVTELGQPVYVEVFAPKHEDKDLVLLLEDCWATPTANPHDPQRWNLLVKGCPFSGDSHRTVVLPVVPTELKYPSLHKWFVVKMFSFVKPPTFDNLVYFHCNVEICKGPDCLQSCSNGRRKLRQIPPGPGKESLQYSFWRTSSVSTVNNHKKDYFKSCLEGSPIVNGSVKICL